MLLCARQCVDSLLPPTSPLGRASCSHPYPESHEGGAKAPEILRSCRAAQPLSPAMTSLCIYLLLKRRPWGCLGVIRGFWGQQSPAPLRGNSVEHPRQKPEAGVWLIVVQAFPWGSPGMPVLGSRNLPVTVCHSSRLQESVCHSPLLQAGRAQTGFEPRQDSILPIRITGNACLVPRVLNSNPVP